VYLNVSPLTVEQLKAGFDCAKQERTTSSASRSRAA
jgi:hypothetical protein